jgi:hypothetical protein
MYAISNHTYFTICVVTFACATLHPRDTNGPGIPPTIPYTPPMTGGQIACDVHPARVANTSPIVSGNVVTTARAYAAARCTPPPNCAANGLAK